MSLPYALVGKFVPATHDKQKHYSLGIFELHLQVMALPEDHGKMKPNDNNSMGTSSMN